MARRVIRGSLEVTVTNTAVTQNYLTGLTGQGNDALKVIGVEAVLPAGSGIDNLQELTMTYSAVAGNSVNDANTIMYFERSAQLTTSGFQVVDDRVYIDLSMMDLLIFQESFNMTFNAVETGFCAFRVVLEDAKITQDQKIALLSLLA